MNEEYSYIVYTFFKNLQEMKEKPPWCLFEIYCMYEIYQYYLLRIGLTFTLPDACLIQILWL